MVLKEGASPAATAEKPVPSITLSITQDDVKRVLNASEAMAETLLLIQQKSEEAPSLDVKDGESMDAETSSQDKPNESGINDGEVPDTKTDHKSTPPHVVSTSDTSACSEPANNSTKAPGKKSKRPLHEMVFEAAQQCEHPMLQEFLEKMKSSGSSPKEVRAGILVFHDLDMPEKLTLIFDVLGEVQSKPNSSAPSPSKESYMEKTLSREGAQSLFRSVIVAISSCIHQDKRVQIEMEKDTVTPEEPPMKRRKLDPNSPNDNSNAGDSVPGLQSPSRSFDSSLGTLKDEDDLGASSVVRKEFEEIAMYAADRLIRFHNKEAGSKTETISIPFATFDDWRASEGGKIAPWLELFNLAKWKTPQRPTSRSTVQEKAPIKEENVSDADKKERSSDSAPVQLKEEAVSADKQQKKFQSPEKKTAALKESPTKKTSSKEASPVAATSSPMFQNNSASRTVVSFDFTGSVQDAEKESGFCINITEDNLSVLRNLVCNTGLSCRPTKEISEMLLGASKAMGDRQIVPIERFHTCLHQLLGSGSEKRLSRMDKDVFSSSLVDFFSCFDTRQPPFEAGDVDAKELEVGFCFLAAGNKSAKLAAGFEQLESKRGVGLTTEQLTKFLRSYLTMLCGVSLLTPSTDAVMKPKLNSVRRKAMHHAVENGSKWTLNHFLKTSGNTKDDIHSFEAFASWYTAGGFNVAPWLELLDLKKLLALGGDASGIGAETPPTQKPQDTLLAFPGSKMESPEYAASPSKALSEVLTPNQDSFVQTPTSAPEDVLFTFPLANQRSLVVLKEDAIYVRKVVDQLGLLSMAPDEVWSSLHGIALKHPPVPPHRGAKTEKNEATAKSMPVDKSTFVECMQELIVNKNSSRKRSSSGIPTSATGARDVLVNFFHSFDLLQVDRVPLNELMGGLTLLCGGKKSTKLASGFGVFDQRPKGKRNKKNRPINSLGGEDLFLFLRSFLIVMFSCCRQSWDLSDDAVNRYIADTANMVADDVMRYQWSTRKKNRIDFDEFGQWYNEGGFETAPWLELLDLKKWVLVETISTFDLSPPGDSPGVASIGRLDPDCPPPPPEDSVDPSFFDDEDGIMPMDSIDEMDLLLMQPSQDKENDTELNKLSRSFSHSPGSSRKPHSNSKASNSLKFQLVTEDDSTGYVVSVSQKRILHLRHILTESGLYRLDSEVACKKILAEACRDDKSGRLVMSKEDFDSAMRGIIASRRMSVDSQRALSAILGEIFTAFDYGGTGQVNATEVACGFTVFCNGKKSDKLEYAFEVLDRDRRGNLSQSETAKYLRSFLTVLLNLASTTSLHTDPQDDNMVTTGGMRCERTMSTVARAVEAGSSWAASQAFRGRRSSRDTICFDEFAEWYTQVGYSNIPWLELLDLQKWVVPDP